MDAKSSLRSSVLSTGNQLMRLKRVDTASLRTALGHIDTQWAELLNRIPVVQEKLHQVRNKKKKNSTAQSPRKCVCEYDAFFFG